MHGMLELVTHKDRDDDPCQCPRDGHSFSNWFRGVWKLRHVMT